ncbi:MAG: M28 family peptidase [Saprospiraceae bacterium]|nr:M28 family peptidase [Saprospiraceae bacterium]MBK7810258.1 M28 family peptidase [Saprospiraceae bacterium]MBK9629861.1 M28 family peptidase [Saprospiraceae bacterium]
MFFCVPTIISNTFSIKSTIFYFSLSLTFLYPLNIIYSQNTDKQAFVIKSFYDEALEKQYSYQWLEFLSEKIGGRIAGSPQSLAAVEFTHQVLDSLGADTVWNQACEIDYWYRGKAEVVRLVGHAEYGDRTLRALALGGSGASPNGGLTGEVIEFKSLDEARAAGPKIKDKIVYFSRPFDNKFFKTFHAYGSAVDQRAYGPNLASKLGAKACIIRSMTGRMDTFPHTGGTLWEDGVKPIPALAISTIDAAFLTEAIRKSPAKIYVETHCENRGKKISYSVIAEIKGSEKPDEIILVGGHLDSWDVGGGAHDDGAGCVHSMEVFSILKNLKYKPRRTLRCVLFMNEENGLAGGRTYAEISNKNGEYHFAAIESDAGGFTPLGFGFDADTAFVKKYSSYFSQWDELLSPYGLKLNKGGGGADIGPLKSQKGILFGLSPDSQRYFDYHHTAQDRIYTVHPRELALGSAAMASLVYLLDQIP